MTSERSLTRAALGREPRRATRLLRRVVVANRRVESALADHLGVNATDYRTMGLLLNRGAMTPGQLARGLGISPALVSLSLDRLEGLGHVERRIDGTDRRRRTVTPAPRSAGEVRDRLMPIVTASEQCLAGFDDKQAAAVETYLAQVLDALESCLADRAPDGAASDGRPDA
ncbi:MAG: MarR family transcriptional regulator [Propionibacterium sp.]|nr:MarR family transcriptional regulator [Propionibacterium sp.]